MDLFDQVETKKLGTSKLKFTVYVGKKNGVIVYVGTTIQKPADRFRWHKSNGKPFDFEVVHQYDNEKDMLDKELELIKLYKTQYNKKTVRQNLNVKLTADQLQLRVGDKQWCQCCLKRRVNKGFTKCYYC